MKQRILLFSASFLLALHLSLTLWVLLTPGSERLAGRWQLPAMLFFSLLHAILLLGGRGGLAFFGLSVIMTWFFEQVGVASGRVFGPYHYGDILGPSLGHVPVVIPFVWFMMLYPSHVIANLIVYGKPTPGTERWTQTLSAAFLTATTMTAWDLAVDPVMSNMGWWVWETEGAYFGVPVQNFIGWLLVSFSISMAIRVFQRRLRPPHSGKLTAWVVLMPLLAYGGQLLRTFQQPELGLIAFFAMGVPLGIAIGRSQ